MTALVTGASGGIGKDIAEELSKRGYDLILAARNEEKLKKFADTLKTKTQIIGIDLSVPDNCRALYEMLKEKDIDIVINNAGFGIFGEFVSADLDTELNMIDLNIKSVHILTKLFLSDFVKKNKGYILNVASAAAFCPGPLLSSYYASKAYVYRLTEAISEELKKISSDVYIGTLCPGPVNTGFNERAGAVFALKGLESKYVAEYAVKQMFKRKRVIIPGPKVKLLPFIIRFAPTSLVLHFCYYFQKRKSEN